MEEELKAVKNLLTRVADTLQRIEMAQVCQTSLNGVNINVF
jgi:flavin-binding protein dodecin